VAVASAPPGVTVPCSEGIPESEQAARSREGSDGPGKLAPIFSKIGNVLILVLYAFRGIFLLLYDWLKGLLKRRKTRSGGGPTGGGSGAGPGAPGGGTPGSGGDTVPNALRRSADAAGAEPAGASAGTVAQSAASAGNASTRGAKASRVASKAGADAAVAGSAAPSRKAAPRRKASAGGNKPVGTKSSGASSPASAVAARVQKKSTRRGIRLKTGGTDGDA
jgi:hypothetical protein